MRGIYLLRHLFPGWYIPDENERLVYRHWCYPFEDKVKEEVSIVPAENGWDKLVSAWETGEETPHDDLVAHVPKEGCRVLSVDPESREVLEEISCKLDEVLDILKELRER